MALNTGTEGSEQTVEQSDQDLHCLPLCQQLLDPFPEIINWPEYAKTILPVHLQNFKEYFIQAISYWKFKTWSTNSVDPDEVAHYELPHQDLPCFQI